MYYLDMPGRNIEKIYVEDSFYHVYNRGLGKKVIFKDDSDYRVFLNLLKRAFGSEVKQDKKGRTYPNFHAEINLLAYCLMPNHFHLLIRTKTNPMLLPEVMKSVATTYVMYFNKRHNRTGPLFGKRYRAVRILQDPQLWHITRYIHMNPSDIGSGYASYEYSSLPYYVSDKSSDWVQPDEILQMFKESGQDYMNFLRDYEAKQEELIDIKKELF